MQSRRRELFTSMRTDGAILPADILRRIVARDSGGGDGGGQEPGGRLEPATATPPVPAACFAMIPANARDFDPVDACPLPLCLRPRSRLTSATECRKRK